MSASRLILLIAIFCVAVPAQAVIIVDDFENDGRTITGPFTATAESVSSGALGDARDYQVTSGGVTVEVNQSGSTGVLAHNLAGTAAGTSILRWDATPNFVLDTSPGLGGVDLTDGGADWGMLLGSVTVLGGAPTAEIRLYDGVTSSTSGLIALTTGTMPISFGLFTGAADLTNITAIELYIRGTDAGDAATVGQFSSVPEPGSIGLLGVAALGGVWYLRRRRKTAA